MKIQHLLIGAICLSLYSCSSETESANPDEAKLHARYDLSLKEKLVVFSPLPNNAESPENKITPQKVSLGHALYFDTRLSKNNTMSCNSCHNLKTYGVDNLPTSPGERGENGNRNSPTVLNAALHAMQFWDGRAKTIEEQAGMPILNPIEMDIPSKEFLIDRLKKIPLYQDLFSKAFPNDNNPISYDNLQNAIGAFERKLLTPSRFDDYLKGDKMSLSIQEKKGLASFINIGCVTCHSGALLGADGYQKVGVYGDYWEFTKSTNIDKGYAEVTKDEFDLYKFKTPSLRNIEKTSPYFHDGSVSDLTKAVEIMAKMQLNYSPKEEEVENIVAFLNALTGEVPEHFQKAPAVLETSEVSQASF